MIGKRNLQRDIVLYSCGLFPLLPAAALPVKPVLLLLYETYFLPLGEALNPILTGFLLGLFPALEEGADYYDRICALLDNLANRIDKFYFYTCIWSAIHLVGTARYPALTFILNHFDKRRTMEDQLYLMGSSVETMVKSLETLFDLSIVVLVGLSGLYMFTRSRTIVSPTVNTRFSSRLFTNAQQTIDENRYDENHHGLSPSVIKT